MKKNISSKITAIVIIVGIIIGLNGVSLAENNTSENTSNQATTQSKKSSNANLKILGIKPYDFTGFKYGTTNYNVTVPENTKSVEVYAEVQDSNAKLTGTGTKNLEDAKTTADVVVTAEDGTKKTYTINITKGKATEENNTNKTAATTSNTTSESNTTSKNAKTEEKSNGLSNLKINELNLTPNFSTGVHEYNVKYIGEESKLDIKAEPTNTDYTVEIIGNKNLKEGENIITILVSDKNGENIATYQITVNKSLIVEKNQNNSDNTKIIIVSVAIVVLIGIIIFIIKRKRDSYYDYDYDEEEDNDDEYEDDEEELPKALRNKHKFEDKYDYEEMSKEKARKNSQDGYDNSYHGYKDEKTGNKNRGKRFK